MNINIKLAFLHAAHNFAVTPSATNWRTLATAMQMHQNSVFPAPKTELEHAQRDVDDAARKAMSVVQSLEEERLALRAQRLAGI
tara:strand:+ start:203 stop:454 length:252 start_codon:yes stop_codon:yes gene_type:complete